MMRSDTLQGKMCCEAVAERVSASDLLGWVGWSKAPGGLRDGVALGLSFAKRVDHNELVKRRAARSLTMMSGFRL